MIEELRRFVLTAKEGNITKTAEKIFITQSALTQSIQRLETELGTKLFVQKGKYLQLTVEGSAILITGEKILQLWENAKSPQLRKEQKQHITIGMFDNAALRLGSFVQKNLNADEYHLELTIDSSSKLFTLLKFGVLDIAVCITNEKLILPKHIVKLQTFSEKLIPVSSKKYLGKLTDIPFILFNKGSHTRAQIDKVFAERNIQPVIFAESTSTTFMKELALLGSGVALLPENFVRPELEQGLLLKQQFPVKWTRQYAVYYNEQSGVEKNNPVVRTLILALKRST